MKVPFQFTLYNEPDFFYTGEMVIDKFFVTWEAQYSNLLGGWVTCHSAIEYTKDEMRTYFENGTWLLKE
jgi:hypothetical protein